MNILIVGNGFDLSHYLPTKYDHFMDVMEAIETKDTGGLPKNLQEKKLQEWIRLLKQTFDKKGESETDKQFMSFEQLFSGNRDPNFIAKTKEFYLTENINLSKKDVIQLQYRLALNCWYQYFKDHVEEIKTWIDFERKIEEVLVVFVEVIDDLNKIYNINSQKYYEYFSGIEKEKTITISKKNRKILEFFSFFDNEKYIRPSLYAGQPGTSELRKNLNSKFCHGEKISNGFDASLFLSFLNTALEEFIEIFNLYLELVVSVLQLNCTVEINSQEWAMPNKIYSFNYTNVYQRLHDSVSAEYLHGSHGEFQNIVLGISDLENKALKNLKAYGFTKYHQKLFKDTDYLFLDEYKRKIISHDKRIREFERDYQQEDKVSQRKFFELGEKLNLYFFIWGHSLDISDKDYIVDLFSLNNEMDRNVRVMVYYLNRSAKFSLLNNLLAILGKEKVEHWMKNKWLQFKQNPEIKFQTEERAEFGEVS